MFDPKALRQSKPNVVVTPKDSPVKLAMMPTTVPPQDMIRERAYQLYESRGRQPGQDEQDWLRAERELLKLER
jgi:DUF2934 family protein